MAANLVEPPYPKTNFSMTFYSFFKIFSMFLILLFLQNCGTARGVLYGTGTVLEGVATDVRTVGNWIS